jgi:hypothetical protein
MRPDPLVDKPGTMRRPAAGALVFRARGPQAPVVGAQSAVSLHDVTIARHDGNLVEIGSGLSPGDRIALNLSSRIAAGDKATITSGDEEVARASKGAP